MAVIRSIYNSIQKLETVHTHLPYIIENLVANKSENHGFII